MSTLDATRVFDRSLRGAHDIEVLLSSFVGTLTHECSRTELSADRVAELKRVATRLSAHAVTLGALAASLSPLAEKEAA